MTNKAPADFNPPTTFTMSLPYDKMQAYPKKNIPDGFPVYKFVEAYRRVIADYWRSYSTFYATSFNLILFANRGLKTTLGLILGWVVETVIRDGISEPSLPICNVLLYYSTPKPNTKPAIEELASRLAQKGLRCVVATSNTMEIVSSGNDSPAKRERVVEYPQLLIRGTGRWGSVRVLLSSVRDVLVLTALVWRRDSALFKRIFRNPLNVWYELLLSAHRLAIVHRLLRQLRPQLIIANGEHIPIAAEMLLSKEASKSKKIWFCNEYLTTPAMTPMLFDEVWVWNQEVINEARRILQPDTAIKFEVIGRAEIDFALQAPENCTDEEIEIRQRTHSKHVLLFVSEYIPNHGTRMGEVTEEALRWIAEAGRQCPDWQFVYKSRPLHHGEDTPGLELIEGLPNCIIPKSEISLRNFLSWDNLVIVTALSSSALLVAAGVGKMAFRLLVTSRFTPVPLVDQTAIPIHSPQQLIDILADFERNDLLYKEKLRPEQDILFPYRGQVIERMESLCLQHLTEMGSR